jgi:CheY-like chemotaxis protein
MPNPLKYYQDKCILIVEDEDFVADDARRYLERLGASILGPVPSVAEAIALIRWRQIDGAILDVKLHDDTCYPIADELERRKIPFVFASAHDAELPSKYRGYILSTTPSELTLIARALFEKQRDH